jgi:hypothetical protein
MHSDSMLWSCSAAFFPAAVPCSHVGAALAALSCCLQEFMKIDSDRYLRDWAKRNRMRDALLSDRTLGEVRRERLNYTQLLYR